MKVLQPGRTGLDWGPTTTVWSKANQNEIQVLVISEVVRMEEEFCKIKAVGQQHQGRWMTWEAELDNHLGRLVKDTLGPNPQNLHS